MKLFSKKATHEDGKTNPYAMLKMLAVIAVFVMVLTWVIPAGYLEGTELIETTTTKLGIIDFFLGGIYTFNYFLLAIVLLILIGGFYGVVSKTAAYEEVVNKLAKFVSKHKIIAMLITSLVFTLLASVFLEVTPLIILIPFVISVMNKANYDKFVTFSTTFGAIMVGILGTTHTGFGLDMLYDYMGASMETNLAAHVVIMIIGYVLINMFAIMRINNKEQKPLLIEDRFVPEKETNKTSVVPVAVVTLFLGAIFVTFGLSRFIELNPMALLGIVLVVAYVAFFALYSKFGNQKFKNKKWPLITIMVSLFIFIILGYTNWSDLTDATIFTDFHNWLTSELVLVINGEEFALFGNLLGTSYEFGAWNAVIISIYLVIFAYVIAKTYGFKLDDTIKYFGEGMKKMLVPTILYAFAHILVVYCNWLPVVNNIVYGLANITESYSIIIIMIIGLVGAFFSSDPGFLGYLIGAFVGTMFVDNANTSALIVTSMYGFAQFLVPTGLLLLAGLNYCDISYTSWLKYIWKFALGLLVALVLVFLILG